MLLFLLFICLLFTKHSPCATHTNDAQDVSGTLYEQTFKLRHLTLEEKDPPPSKKSQSPASKAPRSLLAAQSNAVPPTLNIQEAKGLATLIATSVETSVCHYQPNSTWLSTMRPHLGLYAPGQELVDVKSHLLKYKIKTFFWIPVAKNQLQKIGLFMGHWQWLP